MRENSRGKLPVLDERLGAIAALVRGGMPCVDVGCDHGYLIAYLAASGKIPRGIACDINPMPLQRAQKTLRAYGVENVQTRLTDFRGLPLGKKPPALSSAAYDPGQRPAGIPGEKRLCNPAGMRGGVRKISLHHHERGIYRSD